MSGLAPRRGPRPTTTARIPHSQVDQQPADGTLLEGLLTAAAGWPGVHHGESGISVPGALALRLDDGVRPGPPEAFMVGREFCHGHAQGDHSLHLTLPRDLARAGEEAGWLEPHFLVSTGQLPPTHVMLYAPRDDDEADLALSLVRCSYLYALGQHAEVPATPSDRGHP